MYDNSWMENSVTNPGTDNHDPNEIELEWMTEGDETTNNEEENDLANNEVE